MAKQDCTAYGVASPVSYLASRILCYDRLHRSHLQYRRRYFLHPINTPWWLCMMHCSIWHSVFLHPLQNSFAAENQLIFITVGNTAPQNKLRISLISDNPQCNLSRWNTKNLWSPTMFIHLDGISLVQMIKLTIRYAGIFHRPIIIKIRWTRISYIYIISLYHLWNLPYLSTTIYSFPIFFSYKTVQKCPIFSHFTFINLIFKHAIIWSIRTIWLCMTFPVF